LTEGPRKVGRPRQAKLDVKVADDVLAQLETIAKRTGATAGEVANEIIVEALTRKYRKAR
jgi:hypothetical protein